MNDAPGEKKRSTESVLISVDSLEILKRYDQEPSIAIAKMENLINPDENVFGARVENLYNSMVAPYTRFGVSRNNDGVSLVKFNFAKKTEYRNSEFWRRAFRKAQILRGFLDSHAATLEGMVRTRGHRPPVVVWVSSGRYDTWTAPTQKPVTLEQVLFHGQDPGDWLNPPMPSDPSVLKEHLSEAKSKYQSLVPRYVVNWLTDIAPDVNFESKHFGLLDGIVEARRSGPARDRG